MNPKHMTAVLMIGALVAPIAIAHSQATHHSFSLNATSIKGFLTGEIRLTGGGDFDAQSNFLKTGGSFSCLRDINQGPLAGCKQGEGIRWDAASLLPATGFKCTGAVSEQMKTAITNGNTIVMKADFYRAGDGDHASFSANMIISDTDLDPLVPGIQNVWVQGVGCGEAQVNFN